MPLNTEDLRKIIDIYKATPGLDADQLEDLTIATQAYALMRRLEWRQALEMALATADIQELRGLNEL